MKPIIALALLSGCLVVETSGTPSAPGLIYDCTFKSNEDGSMQSRRVCGPAAPDTAYVVARFHPDPPADPGSEIRCAITVDPCILWLEAP